VSVFCHNRARSRRVMVWAVLLPELFFLNNAGIYPQIEVLYYWRNLDWHFALTMLSFLNYKRHEIYGGGVTDGFSRRIILLGVSLHYYVACVFKIIIDLEPYLISALNTYMYSLFFNTFF